LAAAIAAIAVNSGGEEAKIRSGRRERTPAIVALLAKVP
jgi:hypothetical protein